MKIGESEFTKEDIVDILDLYNCPEGHKTIIIHRLRVNVSYHYPNYYLEIDGVYYCSKCSKSYKSEIETPIINKKINKIKEEWKKWIEKLKIDIRHYKVLVVTD